MTASESERPSKLIPVLGQAMAVGAVLLPALGALQRLLAFWVTDGTLPIGALAVQAPVPEMAISGAQAVFVGILLSLSVMFVLLLSGRLFGRLLDRLFGRSEKDAKAKVQHYEARRRTFLTLALLVPVAGIVTLVLYAPGFPLSLLSVPIAIPIALYEIKLEKVGNLTLGNSWPLISGVFALGIFMTPLTGVAGLLTADYRLTPDTGIAEGKYIQIGTSRDFIYLRDCSGSGTLHAVRTESIRSFTIIRASLP